VLDHERQKVKKSEGETGSEIRVLQKTEGVQKAFFDSKHKQALRDVQAAGVQQL